MAVMYSAMVNSPSTTLASAISNTDTLLQLVDASVLPTAPNLLTIGQDVNAETVRYTNVNGNQVTVERGFQGIAKAWNTGEVVCRTYTAYDHDAFISNINEVMNLSAKVISDNYSVLNNDYIVLCNGASKSFNVTLPNASVVKHTLYFKKTDNSNNVITLLGTIDGDTNYTLELKGEFVQIVSDGTSWQVIAE